MIAARVRFFSIHLINLWFELMKRRTPQIMEWLRDKIDDLRCENYNNNRFVSKDALDKVITLEAVQKVLKESKIERHKHGDIERYILSGNTRVFAVLVRIGYVDSMPEFIRSDQYQGQSSLDQRLPFSEEFLFSIIPENIAKKFYREQWEYAAPIFSKSILPRELHEKTILPIHCEKRIAQGGFGTVYEITIHSAHHSFGGKDNKVRLSL
jgi:hypothetical protein